MPTSNVGGRTTFFCDILTLQFAITENIQEIIEKIFSFLAIINMPVLKSLHSLHLSAAAGQKVKASLQVVRNLVRFGNGPLTQLDRAFDSASEGWAFESLSADVNVVVKR